MALYLHLSSGECTFTSSQYPPTIPLILTAQVIPQCCSTETRVAGIVAEGLIARTRMGDNEILRFNCHRTDKDGQQGYSNHQQDDEGCAGVDMSAHQTNKQTQQQDYR